MGRHEKVQPNDYPKWKELISDIPRKDNEPQKEYVKRLSEYAAAKYGLPEISDKIYVPLNQSETYDEFLTLKNGEKDNQDDDPYAAKDVTIQDPYDREYRLCVLNAITFIIELDVLDESKREKKRKNLLDCIEQIFLKEANR